jgi:RHS repeat-associated protein
VTRAYDRDERLEKVTDWSEHATTFSYDPDSNLKATVFPSETKDEDKYAYNDADQMSEVTMLKGTETLASLAYTRDNDGQVKTAVSKGLPGEEKPAYEYDVNNRLTKGAGIAYEYDAANNPTKLGASTNKYSSADELESGTGFTYAYNEAGQRTKTTPTTGPATTYGYDQAGNLTSVERPKEGSTPEIKDSYAYNGEGLRASQTISGTTTYMTWDQAEELPLLLSDSTDSYIYGPGGLPVEQISSGGTITYLHHDQQGSTRLLTGSTGTVTGSTTFDAYGNKTGSTGTSTTPLGYDGQYTSTDTGMIYMRARTYDPATGQFLTIDPLVGETGAPYSYTEDNPVNGADPSGMSCGWEVWDCAPKVASTVVQFAETLNPVKYYEEEASDYENGCGYFASVARGLEGAAVGALDVSGAGEEAAAAEEGAGATSGWELLSELLEATGHHYVFIGSSIIATGAGAGLLVYEGGKLIYEAVK